MPDNSALMSVCTNKCDLPELSTSQYFAIIYGHNFTHFYQHSSTQIKQKVFSYNCDWCAL